MRLLVLTALAALVFSASASAHFGNLWFQDKVDATKAIEAKYQLDVWKDCMGASFAHRRVDNYGGVTYDHFTCLVTSDVTHRVCWVTEHITGKQWSDIVLTSWNPPKGAGPGCSSADIRKR